MNWLKKLAIKFLRKLAPYYGSEESSPVVVDLDRMVMKSIGIKFNGSIHQIKPMTTQTLLKTVNEIARLDALRKRPNVTPESIRLGFEMVFSKCSDTLGREVKNMNDTQIALVMQQIVECVTGRAYADSQKKKLMSTLPKTAFA